MTIFYHYLDSPVGRLLLVSDGDNLCQVGFPSGAMARRHEPDWQHRVDPFKEARVQFDAYFAGELTQFELPIAPQGTAFQQRVWSALQTIPYGETRSYGELAAQLGQPKAARAVGMANGLNPLPIVIPCHRVIGANGRLTGFAGGLASKDFLLRLEAPSRAGQICFSEFARRADS